MLPSEHTHYKQPSVDSRRQNGKKKKTMKFHIPLNNGKKRGGKKSKPASSLHPVTHKRSLSRPGKEKKGKVGTKIGLLRRKKKLGVTPWLSTTPSSVTCPTGRKRGERASCKSRGLQRGPEWKKGEKLATPRCYFTTLVTAQRVPEKGGEKRTGRVTSTVDRKGVEHFVCQPFLVFI